MTNMVDRFESPNCL